MGKEIPQPVSDEMIMAFVDGELDVDEALQVEQALQSDPALQKKAAMFAETASMLEGVYDAPLSEEVPEHLLRTVREYNRENRLVRFARKIGQAMSFPVTHPAPAFALLALLVLSGGLFYHFTDRGNGYPVFIRDASFFQGLENTPGGRIFPVAGFSTRVSPVATFTDRQNRFCRRFDVLGPTDSNHIIGRGIACRKQTNQWQTLVYQQITSKSSAPSAHSSFELAGSNNPVDIMMDKDARNLLSDQKVRALIKNGWNNTP